MLHMASYPALHFVFEALAYFAGYQVFRAQRAHQGDALAEPQRWTVLAAAAIGALLGSRALGLAEQWPTLFAAMKDGKLWQLLFSPGGKTIVGGLLGGWIAVEAVKRFSGIKTRTGDLFALPLCVGIAVGRIGCFLAGLADDTYGTQTSLPWGVDFGDGIARHPTQIYEILFLALLGFVITRNWKLPSGARFAIFFGSYLAWRVVIDFIKPQPLIHGMNLIQWCALGGLLLLAVDWLITKGAQYENVR